MLLPLILSAVLSFADPAPTVDQLVERVAACQKAVADAREKEAVATKELREALTALGKRLKELGLDPPAPPPPEPAPPPKPSDPLTQTLKVAYAADASPADPAKKAEALKDLIEVYKQAGGLAKSADLGTVTAVIAKVKAAAGLLGLNNGDLVGVRTAIAAELKAAFPADVALDDTGRAKLAAAFGRIHAALSAVSP